MSTQVRGVTIAPRDFEAALRRTQSAGTGAAIKAARLVLVLGLSVQRAAIAAGCARQAVYVARDMILENCEVCPVCGHARETSDGGRPIA